MKNKTQKPIGKRAWWVICIVALFFVFLLNTSSRSPQQANVSLQGQEAQVSRIGDWFLRLFSFSPVEPTVMSSQGKNSCEKTLRNCMDYHADDPFGDCGGTDVNEGSETCREDALHKDKDRNNDGVDDYPDYLDRIAQCHLEHPVDSAGWRDCYNRARLQYFSDGRTCSLLNRTVTMECIAAWELLSDDCLTAFQKCQVGDPNDPPVWPPDPDDD